ncbi:nucleoside-diphosphate sugar epimerase [Rhodopirellula maiorica SM1]|uniref:Nucleoside-diphosphate sugar epimerase n=1 Tax=Rhodopirellula maiorica SM1 TaxID=1265738 RepID=M5RH79_9BACT|nr:TIGR01777 family oxidoreductase [Rhodopirellula maiorica]EMI18723.1 nucleoside-diphosphate sugar epimerase [Rhodopirellula maiorica SM1]
MGSKNHYRATTSLPVSAANAFAYHERPGALQRLTPPWESVAVESSDPGLDVGNQVVLKTSLAGVPLRWVARHTEYNPPLHFADTQVSGPFASWNHHHEFRERVGDPSEAGSSLTDSIEYELPAGAIGRFFGSSIARRKIESMFAYRHRITADDLQLVARYPSEPLRFAISGSSGLVGSSLTRLLTLLGHQATPIVRSKQDSSHDEQGRSIAAWDDADEAKKFGDVDVVVHLAGKSIAGGRWSEQVKQQIRDSRVVKTRQLCESLASLERKPKVLVCASATGIYGDRGDTVLDESSDAGDDFLADVARQWEAACQPAIDAGIRVVNARFGLVLSVAGGALEKMVLPAKMMGGKLGSGKQWWSWIALDDVLGAIYHCVQRNDVSGPVNFVSPEPITNADFTDVLGRVLNRPPLFPAPAFGLRLVLGEMADALLLSSTRVVPGVLQQSGYSFRFTDLEATLRYSLGYARLQSETL